jgi:hypothetical protein
MYRLSRGMSTSMKAVVAVVALSAVAGVGNATATTVRLGPSPLDVSGGSNYCDGGPGGCASRSWVHTVSLGGAYATAARGKIVNWRVAGSAGSGSALELWVVRAASSSTSAVAGPSVASNLAGGDNPVSPPLPFEAGDGIAVTAVGGSSSSGVHVAAGGSAREFTPGFTVLNSPLSTWSDTSVVLQFNADIVLAPVVTETSPATGSSSGGATVTITGSNLDGATGVSFGGTPATAFNIVSPTSITATAPPSEGGSTVDVTVTGPGGTSVAVPGARFSYIASPPAPPADATPPVITRLGISPRAFVAANIGASVVAAATVGGRVTYTLSEPARVTFTVKRRSAGVEVGTTCVKSTPKVLSQLKGKPRRCGLLRSVRGRFAISGVQGLNRFRFTGRLNRRALHVGRYVLSAQAKDAAGNLAKTVRAAFEIRKR